MARKISVRLGKRQEKNKLSLLKKKQFVNPKESKW